MSKIKLNNSSYNLLDSLSSSDSELENVSRPESSIHLQVVTNQREYETEDSDSTNMTNYPISNKIKNVTIVIHLFIVFFVTYVFYTSFKSNVELFTWHPPLMIIGWTLFLTQGILSLLVENPITRCMSHKNKIRLHWILQTTGCLCLYSGFLIVFINKNIKNKHHFATWHAKFGLFSMICIIITSIGGFFALYNVKFKQYIKPIINKTMHAVFGVNSFVFGNITIILGFYSHWFIERTYFHTQIFCTALVFLITAWVILKPIKFIIYRLKIIFK